MENTPALQTRQPNSATSGGRVADKCTEHLDIGTRAARQKRLATDARLTKRFKASSGLERSNDALFLPRTCLELLEPGVLTVAVYANFYPVAYKTQSGYHGLDVDLMREFTLASGLRLKLIEAEKFDGVWDLPGNGLADLSIGGISKSKRREGSNTAWTQPYFYVGRTIVFNKNNPIRSFPNDVKSPVRGTPGSTGYLDARVRLAEAGKESFLQDSNDDEQDILDLLEGRIMGVVRGSSVGKAIVNKYPDELDMMTPWEVLPQFCPSEEGETFTWPTRLGTGLAKCLTSFLQDMMANGRLNMLLEKHKLYQETFA